NSDTHLLGELSALVPSLYRAVRDRVSFNLFRVVDEILHDAEVGPTEVVLSKAEKKAVLLKVCHQVGESFRCHEVSLFLSDRIDHPYSYDLMATTLPRPLGRESYTKNPTDSLTGWVLHHALPVRIFDLGSWKR